MTPPPNGAMACQSSPPPPETAVSAKRQEMEMFGDLFSSFNNTAANGQASTKRLRPEQPDATMPQAPGETAPSHDPFSSQGQGPAKGHAPRQGQREGQGQAVHAAQAEHSSGGSVGDALLGRANGTRPRVRCQEGTY